MKHRILIAISCLFLGIDAVSSADRIETIKSKIREVYNPSPLASGKTCEAEYIAEFLHQPDLDQFEAASWLKGISAKTASPLRILDKWKAKHTNEGAKSFYVERYIHAFSYGKTRRSESVQLNDSPESALRSEILRHGPSYYPFVDIYSKDKRYGPDWLILEPHQRCILYGNEERKMDYPDRSDIMQRWPETIDLSLFLITADLNWIQKLKNQFPSTNSREFHHYPISEKRLEDFVAMFDYHESPTGDLIFQLRQGKHFDGVVWEIILEGTPPYRKKFVQLNDTQKGEVTACAAYVWPTKPGEREILYQFYPFNGNKANALSRTEIVSAEVLEPDEELHQKLFTFTPPKDWVVVDHTQTPTVETRNGEVIDVWTEEKPKDEFEWSFDYIFSSRSKLLLWFNLIAIPLIFYFNRDREPKKDADHSKEKKESTP